MAHNNSSAAGRRNKIRKIQQTLNFAGRAVQKIAKGKCYRLELRPQRVLVDCAIFAVAGRYPERLFLVGIPASGQLIIGAYRRSREQSAALRHVQRSAQRGKVWTLH